MRVKSPSPTNHIAIFSCMESIVDSNLYLMNWNGPYSRVSISIFISTSNNNMTIWISFISTSTRMNSNSLSIRTIFFKWKHSQPRRSLDSENYKHKNGIFLRWLIAYEQELFGIVLNWSLTSKGNPTKSEICLFLLLKWMILLSNWG